MHTKNAMRPACAAAVFFAAIVAGNGQDAFLPRVIPSTYDVGSAERLSISGQGFVPNERIFCRIPSSGTSSNLFEIQADLHGRFTHDFTYPDGLPMTTDLQRYDIVGEDGGKRIQFDILYSAFAPPLTRAVGNGWFSRMGKVSIDQQSLMNPPLSLVRLECVAWPGNEYQTNSYRVMWATDPAGPWTYVGSIRDETIPDTGPDFTSEFSVPYSRVHFFRMGNPKANHPHQLWFTSPEGALELNAGDRIDAAFYAQGFPATKANFTLVDINDGHEQDLLLLHPVSSGEHAVSLQVPYSTRRGCYRLRMMCDEGLYAFGNGTIVVRSPILAPEKGSVLEPGRSYEAKWPEADIPAPYSIYLVGETTQGAREFHLGDTSANRGRFQFAVPISIAEGVYRLSMRSGQAPSLNALSEPFLVSRHD